MVLLCAWYPYSICLPLFALRGFFTLRNAALFNVLKGTGAVLCEHKTFDEQFLSGVELALIEILVIMRDAKIESGLCRDAFVLGKSPSKSGEVNAVDLKNNYHCDLDDRKRDV